MMTASLFTSLVELLGTPEAIIPTSDNELVALWTPIADRTLEDCVYGSKKAGFDVTTVNRIAANAEFISEYLHMRGITCYYTYRTRLYARNEYFYADQYNALVTMYTAFAKCVDAPLPVPLAGNMLMSFRHVNLLEQPIIIGLDYLERLDQSYIYSGECFCGEVI